MAEGGARVVESGEQLRDRLGGRVATVFLVGFAATAFSSPWGVWNGVRLLFMPFPADTLRWQHVAM